jgi:hypothetical protein
MACIGLLSTTFKPTSIVYASVITIGRWKAFLYRFLHPPTKFFSVVFIRGLIKGTDEVPIQKCGIFRKFKEIGDIARMQTVLYAAHAIPGLSRPRLD